jgi:glycosyltransferase involved in cell wall biosynthesis
MSPPPARSSIIAHPSSSRGRVAVVHDWLTGMRGGEVVLEAILELLPDADLFTLFHFEGSVSPAIEKRTIRTSFLQALARRAPDYRYLLPLFPLAARSWDLRGYDLIVSSSHCVAKSVAARGRPHLCYCHTPMRYVWDRFDDYFPPSKPLSRALAIPMAAALRRWDARTSAEVTAFVANSAFVQQRIARFYGRPSEVVHPFARDAFFSPPIENSRGDYYLVVSALVPYKRIDLAIAAAVAAGRDLVVVGSGPLRARLAAAAPPPNVRFVGSVSEEELIGWMGRARSLILPGLEDFGMAVVEAMALGTPVVAYRGGGALDTVQHGSSGVLFDRFDVDSLCAALRAAEALEWNRPAIRAAAARFSRAAFLEKFSACLRQVTV